MTYGLFDNGFVDDFQEITCFQTGTADQTAINIRAGRQFGCIFSFDTATIQNTYILCGYIIVESCQFVADNSTYFFCLGSRRRFAGPDSPDWFIGNDHFRYISRCNIFQGVFDLTFYPGLHGTAFTLGQCFSAAENRREAIGQCRFDFLIDSFVGFIIIFPPFRMADNDMADTDILQHSR